MKISNETLDILKNFASINRSIRIEPGNVIRTISPMKTSYAQAQVTEDFPIKACIYDLSQFIQVVGLFDEPDFQFEENHLTVNEDLNKVKYAYADESLIKVPEKEVKMPSVDVEFTITSSNMNKVMKALGVLGLEEVVIESDGSNVFVSAANMKNDSSNTYKTNVGESDKSFKVVFKAENLRLMGGKDYTISVAFAGIAKFASNDGVLTYYVPCEKSSSYT